MTLPFGIFNVIQGLKLFLVPRTIATNLKNKPVHLLQKRMQGAHVFNIINQQ